MLLFSSLKLSSVFPACAVGMLMCIFAAFGNNLRMTRMIQSSAQNTWNSIRSVNNTVAIIKPDSTNEVAAHQDAIVYLTGKDIYRPGRKNCPSLLHSLGSIARHFPVPDEDSIPDIIILSDVTLDNATQAKIKQASPFPVKFHMNVPFSKTEDEPDVIPGDGSDFDQSYKRMCAFWFKYFFHLDFLPQYVMRMDTDSCLTSDMPKNPFVTMREREIDYMYYSTFREPGKVIINLKNFTETHPGNPNVDHDNDVELLWQENTTDGEMRVFSTNIEWFNMPAFRRSEILEWTEQVMESQGIFNHRWGDAPLRTLIATKFFNSSAVARFCNFAYTHSVWEPFLACDPNNDIHALPARKPKKTLENGTVVETTFGWENVRRRRRL